VQVTQHHSKRVTRYVTTSGAYEIRYILMLTLTLTLTWTTTIQK